MIRNRLSLLKDRLDESRILFIYRYISLVVTSLFYFSNHPGHDLSKRIFIIGCISIAAIILSYLYLVFENSAKNILILLLIETIGNSVILIPSGGIKSPFIWYSLNTLLISSMFLKSRFWLMNLAFYFLNFYVIGLVTVESNMEIWQILRDESNLILSLTMIIMAIRAWAIYISLVKSKNSSLRKVNKELRLANQVVSESVNHIKSLYKSVNMLSNQGNKEGLINLLFEDVKSITKSDTIFFLDVSDGRREWSYDGDPDSHGPLKEIILKDLKYFFNIRAPREVDMLGSRFLIIAIESNYGDFGILGFKSTNYGDIFSSESDINQINFLSELITTSFERLYQEEINERLLVTEEQNRIANEIHDSVLQRLFNMSFGIYSIMKKLDKSTKEDIFKELDLLRDSTNVTMKELRSKIYGLSWKKSGYNSFRRDIKQYVDDIKKFNDVNIPLSIEGNDELLSLNHKKAIYRMICEGIGNALRHGNAKNIDVSLVIDPVSTSLKIMDDGKGFDVDKVMKSNVKGMGILNLEQLTQSLFGQISISSKPGTYTSIDIVIPNHMVPVEREESIV